MTSITVVRPKSQREHWEMGGGKAHWRPNFGWSVGRLVPSPFWASPWPAFDNRTHAFLRRYNHKGPGLLIRGGVWDFWGKEEMGWAPPLSVI